MKMQIPGSVKSPFRSTTAVSSVLPGAGGARTSLTDSEKKCRKNNAETNKCRYVSACIVTWLLWKQKHIIVTTKQAITSREFYD